MKKLLSVILSITMLCSMQAVVFADDVFVSSGAREALGIIKVGVNAEFPPFEYIEKDKLLGFDIDLMNYIGARIGYGIEFINMPFDALIPSVVSGDVDCAISAITITKERESVIDYTIPYLEANVIYNDGEEMFEQYAVVFPDNSLNKARLIEASGDPNLSKYMLVDNAIKELTEELTIDKLIEKYSLNETDDYIFSTAKYLKTEDISDKDIPKYDSWEDVGLTYPFPSDWARADVEKAQALNILDFDGNYNFLKPITREEFCELVYNYAVNFSDRDINYVSQSSPIGDTSNDKIRALYYWGIIQGKGTYTQEPVISPDGVVKRYFPRVIIAPEDLLTREEAATIIERLINVVHPDLVSTELYYEFSDSSEISDWAMSAIQRICNIGIMKGVGNNNFAPQDNYTTEQAIVTLVRVYANSDVSKNVIEGANDMVSFYNVISLDNTKGEEIKKQDDTLVKSELFNVLIGH